MAVVQKYIEMLKRTLTLNYIQEKNIFVQIEQAYNNKKPSAINPPTYAMKPKYYNDNKISDLSNNNKQQATKPKMDNSLELLIGTIQNIQKQYEALSDIVRDLDGKVHGSQQGDRESKSGLIDLMVYYEVPQGKREEVKQRLKNYVLTVNSS